MGADQSTLALCPAFSEGLGRYALIKIAPECRAYRHMLLISLEFPWDRR